MSVLGEVLGFAFLVLTSCPAAQGKPTDDVSLQEKRLAVVSDTFRLGTVVFSRDGRAAAYAASKGGKTYVFVGDRKGEGFDAVFNIEFSPDGKSVSYVAMKGGKQLVVVGEKKGEEFDRVVSAGPFSRRSPLLFTLDGKTVYAAEKDKKHFVVVGEKRGESFDRIVGLTLCSDGKTPLYFGQRGGTIQNGEVDGPVSFDLVVGDKKEQGQDFDRISGETLSPGGNTGAYIGFKGDLNSRMGKYCVVVGDKKGEEFDGISPAIPWLSFSPDGKTVAYTGYLNFKTNRMFYAVVGGQKFEDAMRPTFSPDGKGVAYWSQGGIVHAVSTDGGVTFAPAAFSKPKDWLAPVDSITFSPNSKTMVYRTGKGGGSFVVVGGGKQGDFEEIVTSSEIAPDGSQTYKTYSFSADGNTLAYRAKKEGKTVVVVGSEIGEAFDSIALPRFSPDGKNVAYAAMRAGKWQVVVGGRNGDPFDEVGPVTFTRDGKSAVYRARKGGKALLVAGRNQGEEFDEILSEPVLSVDGRKAAYGARRDRELWWKVMEVKP